MMMDDSQHPNELWMQSIHRMRTMREETMKRMQALEEAHQEEMRVLDHRFRRAVVVATVVHSVLFFGFLTKIILDALT